MKRFILLFFLVLFAGGNAAHSQNPLQEVVYLKNGSMIRGTIIEQVVGRSLKIQTADGSIFVYRMDEVEKITKESRIQTKRTTSALAPAGDITGYRGFVDFGFTKGLGDSGADRLELTTSHGRQFTPYFFTGIGVGIHYYMDMWWNGENIPFIPLFLDLRGNLMQGSIVPFIGLKGGYTFVADGEFRGGGLYAAPSVGVKYMLSETFALNLSLGYSFQQDEGDNINGISIKIGAEF
ncbi:hypothetical protein [Parabacteroides timonensis]|uniref:hypothetical protein n=1 Tax=Parabacteroides timonensis TaxID=1871013 RepID=UPI00094E4D17|nr:hypothetical protein [Parabacteroides timonensis]